MRLEDEVTRRAFLELGAAAGAFLALGWSRSAAGLPADVWNQGQLAHLIPAASHERFLIKASFKSVLPDTPRLLVDGKLVTGEKTDAQGRFWRFDAAQLQPATRYEEIDTMKPALVYEVPRRREASGPR